jgi:hypothetical protein
MVIPLYQASLTLMILFSEILNFLINFFYCRKIKNLINYLRIYHLLK